MFTVTLRELGELFEYQQPAATPVRVVRTRWVQPGSLLPGVAVRPLPSVP